MDTENQSAETTPEASEPEAKTEPEAEKQPLNLAAIEDGQAFMLSRKGKRSPLHEVIIELEDGPVKFNIREITPDDQGQIFIGQWRIRQAKDGATERQFDALATADKLIVMSIALCVVKPDRTPLWDESNVMFMYTGPDKEDYGSLIVKLYQECVNYNPFLLPQANPTAVARLQQWF